jgi:hypothetical protein
MLARRVWVIALMCSAACNSTDSTTEERNEDPPTSRVYPASHAGSSTEQGPGVPDDFSGTVTVSLPLTREEEESLAKAAAMDTERTRSGKRKRSDLGFGVATPQVTR